MSVPRPEEPSSPPASDEAEVPRVAGELPEPNGSAEPDLPHEPVRRARALEAVAVAAFTLWVALPFLGPGYVTGYDTVTYSGPNLVFTWSELRAGRLPTWTPLLFGGSAFAANSQTAVFNPLHWLFLPVDAARALGWITAANLALLAAGMLVLTSRALRLRPPAGLVAAVVVVGGGTVMSRATQFEQLAVIAWIPWALAAVTWLVDRATTATGLRTVARPLGATALAVGLLVVAGHPQQVFLAVPLLAIWALAHAVDATRGGADTGDDAGSRRVRRVGRALGLVAVAGLLGLGIAAVQLLVTAGQLGQSVTLASRTLEATRGHGYALHPELVPAALLGNPLAGEQPAIGASFEAMGFVGAAALALAALGAAVGLLGPRGRARRALTGALVVVAVAGIVLALGARCGELGEPLACERSGLLYRAAFRLVPGFSQARVPGRWLLLTTLAVAVLAALGADALARRAVDRRALAGTAGLLLVAVLAGLGLRPEFPAGVPAGTALLWLGGIAAVLAAAALARRPGRATATLLAVPAALVVLELGLAQVHAIARENVTEVPFTALGGTTAAFVTGADGGRVLSGAAQPPDDHGYLTRALKPNANATVGAASLDGYDGGLWVTTTWTDALKGATGNPTLDPELPAGWQLQPPLRPDALADLGVRYVILDPTATATLATAPAPPGASDVDAARNQLVPGWGPPVHTEGTIETYANPAYHGGAWLEPSGPGSDPTVVPLPVDRPSPTELVVHTDDPAGGRVTVPEQRLPGWSATVDGTTVDLPAEGFSLAAPVAPGAHTVVFTYRAPGLHLGTGVSALSLLVVGLLLAGPAARQRDRRETRTAVSTPRAPDA